MKRRILLLSIPALLGTACFVYLSDTSPSSEEQVRTREPHSISASVSRVDRLKAVEDATMVEQELPEVHGAELEGTLVKARSVEPRNLSGVQLDVLPTGISKVEAVLFENEVADGVGVRRARTLKTDFHYPLLQTLELIEPDAKTGRPEVTAYQAMVADQVLVQLDWDAAPRNWEQVLLNEGYEIRRRITDDGLLTVGFEVSEADQLSRVVESLPRGKNWVRHAEADLVIAARSHAPIPNDPGFGSQWGFRNTGANGGVAGADINAVNGWARQVELQRQRQLDNGVAEEDLELAPGAGYWRDEAGRRRDVIVAVLDTGINYRHLDLAANMWRNPNEERNAADSDGNGFIDDIHGISLVYDDGDPMDFNGHGTHVAGTIGAVGNNRRGVTGVAWDVKLMGIQFLNEFGGGTLSDSIRAIDYAWQNGAHVLNNSWGFDAYGRWIGRLGPSASLSEAIKRTRNAGAIFVTAAGNDSNNTDIYPDYPSAHQSRSNNVVNVGAMERTGQRSVWLWGWLFPPFSWEEDVYVDIGSNYGVEKVHVFAPGSDILSTYVGGNDDAYALLDGTSMAAPHVAGMYAILKAEYPNEPYEVLVQRLLRRAPSNPRLAGYGQKGRMADLAAALDPAPLIFAAPDENIELMPGQSAALTVKVSKSGLAPNSTYTWYHNDVPVDAGTVPSADARGVVTFERETGAVGLYRFEIESPFGKSMVMSQVRRPANSPEGEALAEALGAPHLVWSATGEQPWTPTEPADGVRNGTIGDGLGTKLSTTVVGPGRLDFEWRVSSERNYDWGRFLVGGNIHEQISGESGWLSRTVEIPAGNHEVAWIYMKDSSGSGGEDALWVRNVSYVSDHPIIVSQSHEGALEVVQGSTVSIELEASGADTLNYWWNRDDQLLSDENAPTLTLTNVQASDAGAYVATAGNSHGVARTMPVTLTVVDSPRAPEITQHPENFGGFVGESLTLTADWIGTYPVNAQWYKDGQPLSGHEGTVITLSNLREEDSGLYSVVVTNAAGQIESRGGSVTVYPEQRSFSEYRENLGNTIDREEALLRFGLGLDFGSQGGDRLPKLVLLGDVTVGISEEGRATAGGDALYPALEFYRPINGTGVAYVLQTSADLANWHEIESVTETVGQPEGNLQKVRMRQVEPVDPAQPRHFLRLQLQETE